MPADTRHQQRWLVIVVAILIILLILVIIGLVRSIEGPSSDPRPRLGHRSPALKLDYCAPEDMRLCVVSFGQIEGGDMLVNFHLPAVIYPPFTLVIDRFGVESAYQCNRTKGFLGGMTCRGASQVPGEILLFKVFAQSDGALIAEGRFPIIGIAISTPEDLLTSTGTATATETPTETPTLLPTMQLPELTPTPPGTPQTGGFPTPVPFPSSYPDSTNYP
jgi:hypothetical protein